MIRPVRGCSDSKGGGEQDSKKKDQERRERKLKIKDARKEYRDKSFDLGRLVMANFEIPPLPGLQSVVTGSWTSESRAEATALKARLQELEDQFSHERLIKR